MRAGAALGVRPGRVTRGTARFVSHGLVESAAAMMKRVIRSGTVDGSILTITCAETSPVARRRLGGYRGEYRPDAEEAEEEVWF